MKNDQRKYNVILISPHNNLIFMIPLILDFTGKRVILFGGGEVGLRKARFFHRETRVTVISRSFLPAFQGLNCKCRAKDVGSLDDPGLALEMEGAFLVIAATSDQALNTRIGDICGKLGILFNNADGERGDVMLPSVARGTHYLIAISTGGKSPAVSRYMRQEIEERYAALDAMIELQEEMRSVLKKTNPDQKQRAAILHAILLDDEIWAALETDTLAARMLALERYCT
jgi:precorrin-2 dehydrogenase/sirohydrochlorin ferrochelatase